MKWFLRLLKRHKPDPITTQISSNASVISVDSRERKKCLNSQNNLDEKSSFDGINSFEIRFRQKYNTEIALTKT